MTSPEGEYGPGSRAVGFGLGGSAAPGGPSAAPGGSGPAWPTLPGSGSQMNSTPGPVAKATDPAPAPQASAGAPGSAQGGGSAARAMPAPAVKDTLGPGEHSPAASGSNGSAVNGSEAAKTPAVPAPAAKAASAEPAKEAPASEAPVRENVAKDAPPVSTAKEAPAKEAVAPVAKDVPAPAAAPVAKESAAMDSMAKESVAKESPAPAAKPSPASVEPARSAAPAPRAASSGGGSSSGTATKTATRPDRSDAPVPKSKLGRTRGTAGVVPPPRVRRARLKIANIDPWSVMKVSFLFSVALGIILLVAVTLLWALLDFMGFFDSVAGTIQDISKDSNGGGFDVVAFFSLPRVLGMTTIVALIDIILITALATLGAYLYNLSTDLVGGVEVTLAEEE